MNSVMTILQQIQGNNDSNLQPSLLQHQETSEKPPSKYEDLKLVLILFAIFYGTMIVVLIITLLIRQLCNYVTKKPRFVPPRPNYSPSVIGFDETDAVTIEPANQYRDDQDSAIKLISVN